MKLGPELRVKLRRLFDAVGDFHVVAFDVDDLDLYRELYGAPSSQDAVLRVECKIRDAAASVGGILLLVAPGCFLAALPSLTREESIRWGEQVIASIQSLAISFRHPQEPTVSSLTMTAASLAIHSYADIANLPMRSVDLIRDGRTTGGNVLVYATPPELG